MFKYDQSHIMDNYTMTEWTRLDNTGIFNQVPFGVYAITEPTDYLPSNDILPFMFGKTVYFGKSGTSYDDFLYDRKDFNKEKNKERFYRYSLIERRLKTHRHNFTNRNELLERESSYLKFFEQYGYGEDIVRKMNVCVVVPKTPIPNYCVPAWLLAMESYFIYLYQMNYGKNTLMNLGHGETKKSDDSHAYKARANQSPSLLEFVNG